MLGIPNSKNLLCSLAVRRAMRILILVSLIRLDCCIYLSYKHCHSVFDALCFLWLKKFSFNGGRKVVVV